MNTKDKDISDKDNFASINANKDLIIRDERYILELESKINKLKSLCQVIDPYSQMSDKILANLEDVGITETYDPFSITNQLLFMLENSIQEHLSLRLKN